MWIEIIYLLIIRVIVPFSVGIQIFYNYPNAFPNALSYTFLNILEIPTTILFYRVYLEKFLFKRKWILSSILFPAYILIEDLYARLCYIFIINYAFFIPDSYKHKLRAAHPENFSGLNLNISYLIITMLTAAALVMAKKVIKKEGEMQELRFSNTKLELENLKSQIQPHFFFNTLNNLYNLSLKKSKKAPEIISSLKNIMHYVLYESRQKVPLLKEIKFMNDYFDLERIRHTNPDLIDFKVQGNPERIEIEALLFLPLIENCFKHALQKDMLENPITISLLIDTNKIVFQTSNTLIENKTDEIGGIGLENVKKRLKLLYGDKQKFDIVKGKDRFVATIIIQLH